MKIINNLIIYYLIIYKKSITKKINKIRQNTIYTRYFLIYNMKFLNLVLILLALIFTAETEVKEKEEEPVLKKDLSKCQKCIDDCPKGFYYQTCVSQCILNLCT